MFTNNNPLISVFILCYNHEQYVAQAIESVLNQTYKNIELVIVDNASLDNSQKIIEAYVEKDNRIRFIPMECNTFPSAGSNFAIQHCTGDYICGLSADDYFVLDKISIQLNYMLLHNLSNTFTWVSIVNDAGEELCGHQADTLFNRNFAENEMEAFFIAQGNTICAITWMFHKNMFEKYGYFDNRLLQTQDFDLWLRIAKYEKINILPEKLTCYRVRDDGNNLSVNMDQKASIRSWFEATYYMRHILDFNPLVLSKVTGVECDENNKYKNMFEFYKNQHITPYAVAVLYAMYEKLGANFDFPSNLYEDFYKAHSNFDFMGALENKMQPLSLQLFLDQGNGFNEENSLKLSVIENSEIQEFIFELSKYENITNLRLDPLNDNCVVEIVKLSLIKYDGTELDLIPNIVANICSHHSNSYFFDSHDPQIYFEGIFIEELQDAKSLVVVMYYKYTGKNALYVSTNQTKTELEQTKTELEQTKTELEQTKTELEQTKTSFSWKITKPFRKFQQLLKGIK